MELRVLNYFLTVAREQTISRAAQVLHLSQPTLSKQLKELEAELGVTLFIRGNRQIILTEEGRYLANKGGEILALVDSTTANLLSDEVLSGEITIGGGETLAFEFVARLLQELREKHPAVKLKLYSGNADDVLEKIDKGLLDFGLVIDPVEKQKYDCLPLPLADRWGLLVNSGHPLATKQAIGPADLNDLPLLISNQSLVNEQLADWLGSKLENYNIIGTYNLLYNASLLVKQNTASALCIDGIISDEEPTLNFIPFAPPLTANISIIWKKNQIFAKASKVFLQLLKDNVD